MNIGIDIDGVITNEDEFILACTSKYCYENNLEGLSNPNGYEFSKLNWSNEMIDDYRGKYFDEYVDNFLARMFASEVIQKLKNDGHNIFIITGRHKCTRDTKDGKDMRNRIKNWLDKNNIVYDKLLFAKVPKIKEINENNIDIMIEDSPSTIEAINKIVKVLCYDNRYNRDLKLDNVTRVYSWYDIYNKMNRLT